jgi:hypothetical protein
MHESSMLDAGEDFYTEPAEGAEGERGTDLKELLV